MALSDELAYMSAAHVGGSNPPTRGVTGRALDACIARIEARNRA
jgi:hypothetical protein